MAADTTVINLLYLKKQTVKSGTLPDFLFSITHLFNSSQTTCYVIFAALFVQLSKSVIMNKAAILIAFCFLFLSSFAQTVSADASKNYVGKTVTVAGKVVDGRYLASSGRQPTLLNIDKAFPNQIFSVVIYGDDRKNFGYKPEEVLVNKNILVTGKIEMYKGKPQIVVTSPDQIVIASVGNEMGNNTTSKIAGTNDVQLKSSVKLRSGPGNNYKAIAKLKQGSIVKILHSDNGWSYVSVKRNMEKQNKDYAITGFIETDQLK